MTSEAMRNADEQFAWFMHTLREYDNPAVTAVADALADSTPLAIDAPDLTTDEWLDVLATTAGELYLTASERGRDHTGEWTVRWYCRHDGEAYIYGTENTGELYRGTEGANAYRQVRSVIEHHDVTPYPMDNYPLDERDEYQEVPGDAE